MSAEKWDAENEPKLVLLYGSLPTSTSAAALKRVSKDVKIRNIGGDHHYADGWAYGLADVWPTETENPIRVTNPGCFPALIEIALAHHW